jgi:hypothetical protein
LCHLLFLRHASNAALLTILEYVHLAVTFLLLELEARVLRIISPSIVIIVIGNHRNPLVTVLSLRR